MPGHTSPWITKQIKYSGTLYTESNPHSWRHTNKSMHISELGPRTCTVKLLRSSVMPLILSAWVKSEERGWSNRGWKGLWGSGGCVDAEACGDHVSPTPPLSPPPPKVLNVKCLTGRFSEEELQRTMAHWSQAGGCAECRGSCSQAGFCQLPHARITLPFCTAITGLLLHWESNDLMALLTVSYSDYTFTTYGRLAILIRRHAFIKTLQRMSRKQALILHRPTQLWFPRWSAVSSLLRKMWKKGNKFSFL